MAQHHQPRMPTSVSHVFPNLPTFSLHIWPRSLTSVAAGNYGIQEPYIYSDCWNGYMYKTCNCLWVAPTNWDSSPSGLHVLRCGCSLLVGLTLIDTWEWMVYLGKPWVHTQSQCHIFFWEENKINISA